jgi:hypothetical protein
LEDALKYDEPPCWMIPLRHTIDANLMAVGRFAEAEQVYHDDLKRLPGFTASCKLNPRPTSPCYPPT